MTQREYITPPLTIVIISRYRMAVRYKKHGERSLPELIFPNCKALEQTSKPATNIAGIQPFTKKSFKEKETMEVTSPSVSEESSSQRRHQARETVAGAPRNHQP